MTYSGAKSTQAGDSQQLKSAFMLAAAGHACIGSCGHVVYVVINRAWTDGVLATHCCSKLQQMQCLQSSATATEAMAVQGH
jgi:hypothetical protein